MPEVEQSSNEDQGSRAYRWTDKDQSPEQVQRCPPESPGVPGT